MRHARVAIYGVALVVLLLIGTTDVWSEAGAGQASPDEVLAQARAFEIAQQYEQAMAGYRAYLATRPEDDEVRGARARVLSWQGMYDEAVALYEDILTRHPEDLDVRTALARVKSWQKQFAEARRLYEGILNEDAQHLDARRGLADTFYWSGDYAAALRQYEEVFTATQDPEIAQRLQVVRAELTRATPLPSPRAPLGGVDRGPALPYRDYVKFGHSYFAYTKGIADERDWLVEIAKPLGAQTFVGRVEVLDRFGLNDSVIAGELYSPLWDKAWGHLAAAAGIDADFVPNWTVGGEIFQGLGILHPGLSFLEASFGYRRMSFREADIDLLIPGLTVYFPYNIWLTEKVYYVPDTGSITLSSQLTWRATDRLQLFVAAAFGTSGERLSAPQDFRRVTTHVVQGGVTFPLTDRLSAEVGGYYEDRKTLYVRRGGTFNLIFHW